MTKTGPNETNPGRSRPGPGQAQAKARARVRARVRLSLGSVLVQFWSVLVNLVNLVTFGHFWSLFDGTD